MRERCPLPSRRAARDVTHFRNMPRNIFSFDESSWIFSGVVAVAAVLEEVSVDFVEAAVEVAVEGAGEWP